MNGLSRAMAVVLRRAMALVSGSRRDWAEAIWAEAAEVPAGWQRLSWLAGGLRLTVREAARGRRLWYPLAFASAAAGTAWSAWPGPPGDPAIEINRIDVIAVVAILAGLSGVVGRARGPVADSRMPGLVRAGGYAAILALVLVKSAVERVADAPPNNLQAAAVAWAGEAVFLAVTAGYAAVIMVCTARRSPLVPATMAIGLTAGVPLGVLAYLLGPLGFPLRFAGPWPAGLYDAAMALALLLGLFGPAAAGLTAVRRADPSRPARSRAGRGAVAGQGTMAGLWCGAAAALVVTILSTATIAVLPYDVALQNWAVGHIGHWAPAVGQVTPVLHPRVGYIAGNSAFAAGYLLVLLISPLAGGVLGACGACARPGPRPGSRPGPRRPRPAGALARMKRPPARGRLTTQDQ